MKTLNTQEVEIDQLKLQRIIEHEMALSACENLLQCASSVEELHSGIYGSNNLSRCFRRNESNPDTLELSDGPRFLRSKLLFFVFALAKYNIKLGSISFGYLRGLMKALEAISAEIGLREEDWPDIVDTIVLYYFNIYSEFELETKRLVFDDKWIESGVAEFLNDIRKEKGDRDYVPKIDRETIMKIVEKHSCLWIMLYQEAVLGEELLELIV